MAKIACICMNRTHPGKGLDPSPLVRGTLLTQYPFVYDVIFFPEVEGPCT